MNIPAFLVYCAIMAVTPGPNNLMSLYLGASGGSRFWRFFAGSMAGLFVKCALCGLLNVLLAELIPALVPYLKWLGAMYMLYLAFGMVRSGLKPAGDDQRSGEGSFESGILLQVLNVKSWVAALSIFSVYIIPFTTAVGAMLLAALAFTLFCALASLLWFGCGAAIQRLYRRFRLPVSIVLAAMLLFFGNWWTANLLYVGLALMIGVSIWDLLSPANRRCELPPKHG